MLRRKQPTKTISNGFFRFCRGAPVWNTVRHNSTPGELLCCDGNFAAAKVSYALSDSAFLYPITPSSTMGELADEWCCKGMENVFDQVPQITVMQSEGGAAGALHGAIKAGGLSTTYTSSQGLLLMIPNMYRISGELNPCVMHVSSRTIATHALSIFGDHSDVIAAMNTGWAMLASDTVQACHDLAIVSHFATLETRVPMMHFFEGFRTSHEISKISALPTDVLKQLVPWDLVKAHRDRMLHPSHPSIQGTAHGNAVFFQAAEAANPFYEATPGIVQKWMDLVGAVTGRKYKLFEYEGHKDAEHIIIVMGTGGVTTSEYCRAHPDEKVGTIRVRLFRPWSPEHLLEAIPKTAKRITVLDRCKDPGAVGEPLLHDVMSTLYRARGRFLDVEVVGGRYGIAGKDFTPGMVRTIYKNMRLSKPKDLFTVGIEDDVTHRSLPREPEISSILPSSTKQCIFYGYGSDGTVSANKTAISLIGDNTKNNVQGYFTFDSKKSGSRTVSHLRFGPDDIEAPYTIQEADYIAIHKSRFISDLPLLLNRLKEGGTVVLNMKYNLQDRDANLPSRFRKMLALKKAKFYRIDAEKICREAGLQPKHINMVMQSVFFYLTNVIPYDEAVKLLNADIANLFAKKGEAVINKNRKAIELSLQGLVEVPVPEEWKDAAEEAKPAKYVGGATNDAARMKYIEELMKPMNTLQAESLPVSKLTQIVGGLLPPGTTFVEKRGIALQVPKVDMDKCTQCNYCSVVCPHAAIRPFLLTPKEKEAAPRGIAETAVPAVGGGMLDNYHYRIQVSPLDCTGCELCAKVCPSECLEMRPLEDAMQEKEGDNWDYVADLPVHGNEFPDKTQVKGSQFQRPYLEFSGACEGCGETAYVKLLTQLLGDRLVIANATGCSRVWGTTVASAYTTDEKGAGPAFGNSLFEDNAEYSLGMLRTQRQLQGLTLLHAQDALADQSVKMSEQLRRFLDQWAQAITAQKLDNQLSKGRSMYQNLSNRIIPLLEQEKGSHPKLQRLYDERHNLMRISQWTIGGDGWAYDIGFGGLDHVLAMGDESKVLILDTEMYSNTGGQASKASNLGATQKFAAAGHRMRKKDLGAYCIATYGHIYVASININANHQQALKALLEAEAHPGPAVIMAYSPCITHGYPLANAINQCREAVESGYWPLYRYNPELKKGGKSPFMIDSKKITSDVGTMKGFETRYAATARRDKELADKLHELHKVHILERQQQLQNMAAWSNSTLGGSQADASAAAAGAGPLVLFGSETGNAEDLARTFVGDLQARGAKNVQVASCDDFDFEEIKNAEYLCVVISTCGQGEFPANSKKFWKELSDAKYNGKKPFEGLRYCVFGLGDSTYAQYCVTAKWIDARLAELGGTRVHDCGLGDDRHEDKFFTGWEEWVPQCFTANKLPTAPLERKPPVPSYELEVSKGGSTPVMDNVALVPVGAVPSKLQFNQLLTPEKYDRDIRHFEFDIAPTPLKYVCGDSLAIYAKNPAGAVDEFCAMYGLNPTDELNVVSKPDARNALPTELNVRQLFMIYLDVFGKPSKKFYEHLLNFSKDDAERKKLELLIEDSDAGKAAFKAMQNEMVNFADVLKQFPNSRPPLVQLMNVLPSIKPRSYSISSSPLMHPKKIELTVVKVDWQVPSTKETRFGTCTGHMVDRAVGETINCAIRKSAIVVPEDITRPVIMAGMGTGIAPWRAMTQERIAHKRAGKEVGPVMMFYGARKAASEFLYEKELTEYIEAGVLDLHCAFSRDQKHKIYVQHRIAEQYEKIYKYMVEQNGIFYVCGSSVGIPEDVFKAMTTVMIKGSGGKVDEAKAHEMLNQMKAEERYIVEAWA